MSRKNPSPMSLPIARLRALGFRVATTISHNPNAGHQHAFLSYRVTEPDGVLVHIVEARGYNYDVVVRRLDALANRAEIARTPFYLLDRVAGKVLRRTLQGAWVWAAADESATRFATQGEAEQAATEAGGDVVVRRHG